MFRDMINPFLRFSVQRAGLDALDPKAEDDLHRARRGLKHALMRTRDCTPDEARRIAANLEHATADILGTQS